MTTNEALQKFKVALTLDQSPSLHKFYNNITDSNLPPDEKNFWCCLCNDFMDIKETFFNRVASFVANADNEIDRAEWLDKNNSDAFKETPFYQNYETLKFKEMIEKALKE